MMRGMRDFMIVASVWFACVALATDPPAKPIRFGVQMAPEDVTYEQVLETARLVEQLGYDSFWLNDHFIPILGDKDRPHLESWIVLAALAPQTERIRLGILVTGNTYRHPAVLAKMATTVDQISRGRLDFGIGAGWEEFEHTAYGIPFYTAKERAERLGEALEVITRLWRDDHPSYDGTYYDLAKAPFAPKPVQRPHPPIVVGGQGKQWIMPIVARYADEWNVPVGITPEGMQERLVFLRQECQRIGRTPCVSGVSVFLPLANITAIPLAGAVTRLGARVLYDERAAISVLAGSASEITEKIRTFTDAGADHVIITTRPAINHDLMRRFATEIMPAFRQAAAAERAAGTPPRPVSPPPAAAGAAPPDLVGTEWLLEDLGAGSVLEGVQSTIAFPEPGRVAGSGGCNRYMGAATITGDRVEIGPLAGTKMACPPAVMEQERRFLDALAKVERLERDGPVLSLHGAGLERPLRFTRSTTATTAPAQR